MILFCSNWNEVEAFLEKKQKKKKNKKLDKA